MKKTDYDPTRIDASKEHPRLEGHPEPRRIEEYCQDEQKAAATPVEEPYEDKVYATTDAQETAGFARGAGWTCLAILGLMLIATYLWWPTRRDTRQVNQAYNTTAYQSRITPGMVEDEEELIIAAVPVNAQAQANAYGTTAANAGYQKVSLTPSTVVIYLFDTDNSNIGESSTLNYVANLANQTGKTVVVKAYTDETGRRAYNQRLSERRANAVADYMHRHGVPTNHIKAKGYGPTHAYANNAVDRRAEISLE